MKITLLRVIIFCVILFIFFKGYHLYRDIPEETISKEIRAFISFLEITLLFVSIFLVSTLLDFEDTHSNSLSSDELNDVLIDLDSILDVYLLDIDDDSSTVWCYFNDYGNIDTPSFEDSTDSYNRIDDYLEESHSVLVKTYDLLESYSIED